MSDKEIERRRYDERAKKLHSHLSSAHRPSRGAYAVPVELREPYTRYEFLIRRWIDSGFTVLEIGAGTGEFTIAVLESGANVVATDISAVSLDLLIRKYADLRDQLAVHPADMESLPFDDESFDCVTSAGSLSYGDNGKVLAELYRVLRPGGRFICVDSLNHNPIYRANRCWHYLRGRRSRSTLERMPTMALIERYRQTFGEVQVDFYGSLAWITPVAVRVVGPERARQFLNWFDRFFHVTRSAFKFVMVVTKKRGKNCLE